MFAYLHSLHMSDASGEQKKGCPTLYGFWKLNPGPLEEKDSVLKF